MTRSAKDGGLLPPLKRGRTMPEFEKAAFSTPLGQTTGVVRTSYGFHIIHVEAKQEARLKPLDEVKVEIEPILNGRGRSAGAEPGEYGADAGATEGLEQGRSR